jgi:hypothetical protein
LSNTVILPQCVVTRYLQPVILLLLLLWSLPETGTFFSINRFKWTVSRDR